MKIAIIIGSVRQGRVGEQIAHWVTEQAAQLGSSLTFEKVDLLDFDLPIFNSPVSPRQAERKYEDPRVQKWSAVVDSYDGFIFVTPEYNHSVPGAFKNAFDFLAPEWTGKPIGFVGYSYSNAAFAIAHWREIVATMSMDAAENEVTVNLGSDFTDGTFTPSEVQDNALRAMVKELDPEV
ncbi:NADPH-dependent FMN reductase [Rothia sp. LK2588]|uniref:NADPH-dependent FMN reductase n=1 Tax=Rothia sp. LK2588 TaxID=3114369 RepID=UPI0034CF560B